MNIFQIVVLSIVEGITEFLPVSSTLHLILTSKLLSITQNEFLKLFEVFIQSGAILSVLLLYFKTLLHDKELIKKTLVSFLPTAIIGLVLYKVIKNVFFESEFLMIAMLIIIGIVFIVIERYIQNDTIKLSKKTKDLTYAQALLLGFAQALAIIPGVSRAGSVLITMMLLGYKRDEAARYSFILSIPTILAASFYDLYKMRDLVLGNTDNMGYLLLGFLGAFMSAYFVVKWLIAYLQRNSLVLFGWYRIVLGIIVLISYTIL